MIQSVCSRATKREPPFARLITLIRREALFRLTLAKRAHFEIKTETTN